MPQLKGHGTVPELIKIKLRSDLQPWLAANVQHDHRAEHFGRFFHRDRQRFVDRFLILVAVDQLARTRRYNLHSATNITGRELSQMRFCTHLDVFGNWYGKIFTNFSKASG